jgi:hypothetical protein
MRLFLWLGERRIALVAAWRTRRAFRGGQLSPAARQQLREAAKRKTP